MNTTITACLFAMRAFAWPDPSQWPGLPECKLDGIAKVFTVPDDGGWGSGYLGEENRSLLWLTVSGGGFPDSIRVWLDGDKVVMLDTPVRSRPEELQALVARLGAPAAKLDAYFRNALLEESEWVYPDRGLTLFIEPETHVLLHLAAYPRTSLTEYRRQYRFMGGQTIKHIEDGRTGTDLSTQHPQGRVSDPSPCSLPSGKGIHFFRGDLIRSHLRKYYFGQTVIQC